MTDEIYVARAALHMWEEPCISGKAGSGAVFFSGCGLRCIYCQNHHIAQGRFGRKVDRDELAGLFLRLQEEEGAANINLVTAVHYLPDVCHALEEAKAEGLKIPVVYNTSGYERVEALKELDGLVDIYLPDFKYLDSREAEDYSRAPDYPEVAKEALAEMARQQPVQEYGEDGMMKKGIIVRHLLLPGHVINGKAVLSYLYHTYGDAITISIMDQYTPMAQVKQDPLLHRKATKREYNRLVDYALELGITNAFLQEGPVAEESFIPDWDEGGIL